MKNTIFLAVLLLAACGSKDNVSTDGDKALLGGGNQGQIDGPLDPGGEPTKGTFIQIACESPQLNLPTQISFPHSQMDSAQRMTEMMAPFSGQSSRAPTVLGLRDHFLTSLVVSGSKIYFTNYDLWTHELSGKPMSIGRASGSSASVYSDLGFSQPRLAAASPNGRQFFVLSGGDASLRSMENPEVELARMSRADGVVQPRWDGQEIFVDRNSDGKMKQAVILLDGASNQIGMRSAPAPLSSSLDQIGLRRYNESSYIWLERSSARAVLRVWNPSTNAVMNYELPGAKRFGPGFALVRPAIGAPARAALNSRDGLHYFTLGANGTIQFDTVSYPQDTLSRLNPSDPQSKVNWKPGAIYSAAGDTQLFVIIPAAAGDRLLYAIDGLYRFRPLGFEACANPDFYRTRN